MNRLSSFLKITIIGGLVVLLPVLLLYLLLSEAVQLILALATPIADLFPKGTFDRVYFPVLMALLLIVLASFLTGLAARSAAGRRLGSWIERTLLAPLPLYGMLKGLTAALIGTDATTAFKPALLLSDDGGREPAYIVEDHGNGRVTVLVPWAPTPFAGSVKIVARERIELLEVSLGDFSRALSHLGVGMRDVLDTSGRR